MNPWYFHEIAQSLNASWSGTDTAVFAGVSIDSRSIQPGDLFIALRGERFDGHQFIPQAIANGAVAVMVEEGVEAAANLPIPQLRVANTRLALGQLAQHWRLRFNLPIIAITGSNGKTTVKTMVGHILSHCGPTLITSGNLNNAIGVPLTLLRLRPEHQFAVIEMGANHAGEIRYLTGLTQPAVALLINAGAAHLEGFGSLEGVARAKAEIFTSLQAEQTAVINLDDQFADFWLNQTTHCQQLTFGMKNTSAQVRGQWQAPLLRLQTPKGETEISLSLLGQHNALNALAAAAAAVAVPGITLEAIQQGLSKMQAVKGRLCRYQGMAGTQIIDDTYNANPTSFLAGLQAVADLPGETWLILGDMLELGADTANWHKEAGKLANQYGVTRLFTLGQHSKQAAIAFAGQADHFTDKLRLTQTVLQQAKADVNILIKGSRGMQLEQVVQQLILSPDNQREAG